MSADAKLVSSTQPVLGQTYYAIIVGSSGTDRAIVVYHGFAGPYHYVRYGPSGGQVRTFKARRTSGEDEAPEFWFNEKDVIP